MTVTEGIPVHLYLLVDRTGSMELVRTDVIGGFNSFLRQQKGKPGECLMTLVQFDDVDPFEVLADAVPLDQIDELTEDTYIPRGCTPLLDAEGRLMVKAEERAAARRAAGLPDEAILITTYTDGRENASREWTFEQVCAKKKAHEDDWAFLYLGVGHDAYKQARQVGTMSVNTVSAPRNTEGNSIAYDWYVGEVDNVRTRASRGAYTSSAQTAAAAKAESDRRSAAAESAED